MTHKFRDFKNSPHAKKSHFLVIGNPISHSLSPLMHQTALDYYKIDATYLSVNLSSDEITDFIAWCNQPDFKGCNVTIPYKQAFMEVVDEIDSFAEEIGVINTIAKSENRLIGYNTDAHGFLMGLEPCLDVTELSRAVIFGTGGSSRAVKAALQQIGFDELVFVSRRASTKTAINQPPEIRVVDYDQWPSFAEEASLFVNTTPLGMHPKTDKMPIRDEEAFLFEGKLCYDLIYNPAETRFLKVAKENGASVINGLDMLIHQGSKSFELWTGKPFPAGLIKKNLLKYFES